MSADPTPPDRETFIRRHTRLLGVPLTPEISLHLADEATELWQKTEDELAQIGLPPPFWAFAWAGGQALARYVLDHPGIVRGRRVLDLASGSGLVAIAAALAGAASVEASDIDAFAIAAIALNSKANDVGIVPRFEDLVGGPCPWDVVLAADVAYEADMAARFADWLEAAAWSGVKVLLGDPGRTFLPRTRLVAVADYHVPVTRALEDSEIKHTCVWRFRPLGNIATPA